MTGRQSYGDALARFYDELGGLRAEFPQLTTVPNRLLFYDLRAKTKHSGLASSDDVEAVLAHRVPHLSSDSRQRLLPYFGMRGNGSWPTTTLRTTGCD